MVGIMRLKVTFVNSKKAEIVIPINTNYYLVKIINELIYEYKYYLLALLPDRINKRFFDQYTFSQLIIPKRIVATNIITILSDNFYWYISSPYFQFLGILAKELRERRWIKVKNSRLDIEMVEYMGTPEFTDDTARFTCLSPVAVSRQYSPGFVQDYHSNKSLYILPGEEEYLEHIEMDLLQKYNKFQKQKKERINFNLEFDQNYLRKRNNRITKIIRLEREDNSVNVMGILAPFCIKADPDVLQMIYDLGLGQFNSLGFGMVEKTIGDVSGIYAD
jgi:CRISPR-associated endoribonuclease Cas6